MSEERRYGTSFVFHLPSGSFVDSEQYAFWVQRGIAPIYTDHNFAKGLVTITVSGLVDEETLVLFMLMFEAESWPESGPPYI